MNPTKIRCPHCGNNILVKQSGKVACPFCGTALYVEEKEKKVEINVNLGRKPSPKCRIIFRPSSAAAQLFFCCV